MKQRWTFRFYPTAEQEVQLARTFGCVRYAWNWALRLRSDSYRDGVRINYPESDKRFNQLKLQHDYLWLNEVASVPLQQSLRDLEVAFSNFFAKRANYPSFKRKSDHQSANYSVKGFSFDSESQSLRLAKVGALNVRWSRDVIPQPSSVRLIRKPSGRYFISLVVNVEPVRLAHTGKVIGIDFGINRLATLSDGGQVSNPKHGSKLAKKLAHTQRRLARKVKGSKRRVLAKRRVARVHEKIANRRKDTVNKFALDMVRRFDVIYIEDLHLRGMLKNHSIARALSDASIGAAARKLEEKAEMHGKKVIRIDRFFPSTKTCSGCGFIHGKMPLSVRAWTCPECGAVHDRDVNAAINIMAVGQTVSAQGGGVRTVRAKARKATSRRAANQQRNKQCA